LPEEGKLNNFFLVPVLFLAIYSVRPEGFGYVAVLALTELLRRIWCKEDLPAIGITIAISTALILFYEGFGLYYYGCLLPDSASAKIGGSLVGKVLSGLRYSLSPVNFFAAWIVPASVILLSIDLFRKKLDLRIKQHASIFLGGVLTASLIGFVLLSGGDWMPAARFYSIALPFASSYIAWSLLKYKLIDNSLLRMLLLMAFAANQFIVGYVTLPYLTKLQVAEDRALQGMVEDLNAVSSRQDTLALSDIGRAAYGFNGNVYDWWGLASRDVRERKQAIGRIRSETILEANPEYLVIYANSSDGPKIEEMPSGMAHSSRQLVEDKNLMNRYCRIGAYYFWEERYHVLLARHDVWRRINLYQEYPEEWSITKCIHPIYEMRDDPRDP
jgi:hypothetical protein